MRIFVIGCQYTGLAAARFWKKQGHFVTVTTTRESRVAELSNEFDKVVVMRGSDVETMQTVLPQQDAVLMSVAGGMIEKDGKVVLDADAYTDTYLGTAKNLVEALKNSPSVKHITFPSSTSAYGDGFGKDLVTEDDETNPMSIFQSVYVDTEKVLLSAENDSRKICILRTGNIYGIGRELKNQAVAMSGKTIPLDGDAGAMIIHRDDVVRAADYALRYNLSGIYNLVNDISDSKSEFFGKICEREGLEKITWSPFGKGVKNVSNAKIKHAGFSFADADATRESEDLV
ncbi:MAG: NAD-dependent epimerase/dehydratase family protein [Pyrinomonadaceae bacterium]|jgi:nucleoside-diphosphate-sugar epimerase|nr:NAD-dependent epimerase/dehydratase family protein [Pyrinomonadaceae bacterium]